MARRIERLLARAGYTSVESVPDAGQLEAECREREPDLILLDPFMPGFDAETAPAPDGGEDWASRPPRPPIVALAPDGKEETRARALEAGALGLVIAPFAERDVLLRVRNLLARRFLELDLWSHGQLLEQLVSERTHQLEESLEHLQETSRQRHELGLRLVKAQEEERRRVAAEVHDGSIQTLVALRIRLGMLVGSRPGSEQRAQVDRRDRMAADALAQLRSLTAELTTPALELSGLAVGMQEYLDSTREDAASPISFQASASAPLSAERQLMLFRIAQEAVTNARKHASDAPLTVRLTDEADGVKLVVHDDGPGFDTRRRPQPGHLGLTLMKERAVIAGGWCRIDSAPGRGTTVEAWAPAGARTLEDGR